MTAQYFWSLNCVDDERHQKKQKHQLSITKKVSTNTQVNKKLAYSFKKKTYVQKSHELNNSTKPVKQNKKLSQTNRYAVSNKQNLKNRLSIQQQYSYKINLNFYKLKKSISTNFSSFVGELGLSHNQHNFDKDHFITTKETQLRRAQLPQNNPKVKIYKKLHEKIPQRLKLQTDKNFVSQKSSPTNRNNPSRSYINENKQLFRGKSQGNLLKVGLGLKKQTSSNFQKNFLNKDHIIQQKGLTYPTFSSFKAEKQKSLIPLTNKINNNFKNKNVKIQESKRKIEQLQIRSTCSIKQEQSSDEFSEVIEKSAVNLEDQSENIPFRLFNQLK